MTLMADQHVSANVTLYSRALAADPDRQAAEDFYQWGAAPTARAVAIQVVGGDGSRRREWLAAHLEDKINELLSLPAGWDGEAANQISLAAVGTVAALLGRLSADLKVAPFVFPLPDGGLQVEWHAGRQAVEIEVDGEGSAHLLTTDQDGTIELNNELQLDEAGLADARRAVERLSARLLGMR